MSHFKQWTTSGPTVFPTDAYLSELRTKYTEDRSPEYITYLQSIIEKAFGHQRKLPSVPQGVTIDPRKTEFDGIDENGRLLNLHSHFVMYEYGYNAQDQPVRMPWSIRIMTPTEACEERIAQRRSWAKFGDVKDAEPGPETGITTIGDEVFLNLTPKRNQQKQEEEKEESKFNMGIVCRICTGDHWTTKCPNKDALPELKPMEPVQTGKYVPPTRRNDRGRNQQETFGLRISNLPYDVNENDIRDYFGPIQRIYLARDRVTNQPRGFAFVHFYEKDHAEHALNKVNGHAYDHMILDVEIAKPRR